MFWRGVRNKNSKPTAEARDSQTPQPNEMRATAKLSKSEISAVCNKTMKLLHLYLLIRLLCGVMGAGGGEFCTVSCVSGVYLSNGFVPLTYTVFILGTTIYFQYLLVLPQLKEIDRSQSCLRANIGVSQHVPPSHSGVPHLRDVYCTHRIRKTLDFNRS